MFAFEQLLKLFSKIEKFKYVEYNFFKGHKTQYFNHKTQNTNSYHFYTKTLGNKEFIKLAPCRKKVVLSVEHRSKDIRTEN